MWNLAEVEVAVLRVCDDGVYHMTKGLLNFVSRDEGIGNPFRVMLFTSSLFSRHLIDSHRELP